MKITGGLQIATSPETGDLTKQRINFNEEYTEIDSAVTMAFQYGLELLKDDSNINIIPSQFTRVRFLHVKARFPDAAYVRTIGIKIKKTGGPLGVDYHDCREYLIHGETDIVEARVINNEQRVRLLKLESTSWLTLTPSHIGKVVDYTGGSPTDSGICLAYDNALYYIWVLTSKDSIDLGYGVGTLNTLTDSTKSWTPSEHIGRLVTDAEGTEFLITANGATTLTVVGTPATGFYQIHALNSFSDITTLIRVDGVDSDDLIDTGGSTIDGEDCYLDIILIGD